MSQGEEYRPQLQKVDLKCPQLWVPIALYTSVLPKSTHWGKHPWLPPPSVLGRPNWYTSLKKCLPLPESQRSSTADHDQNQRTRLWNSDRNLGRRCKRPSWITATVRRPVSRRKLIKGSLRWTLNLAKVFHNACLLPSMRVALIYLEPKCMPRKHTDCRGVRQLFRRFTLMPKVATWCNRHCVLLAACWGDLAHNSQSSRYGRISMPYHWSGPSATRTSHVWRHGEKERGKIEILWTNMSCPEKWTEGNFCGVRQWEYGNMRLSSPSRWTKFQVRNPTIHCGK